MRTLEEVAAAFGYPVRQYHYSEVTREVLDMVTGTQVAKRDSLGNFYLTVTPERFEQIQNQHFNKPKG